MKKQYDDLEIDGNEVRVLFNGEEVDRVYLFDLVNEFLQEQGYEKV